MALLELFKEQVENESRAIADAAGRVKRGDLLIWWYFHKLVGLSLDEIDDLYCDGSNDFGIDAVYIDDTNIVHFYSFKNPNGMEKAFPGGDIDKLITGLGLLIQSKLTAAHANPSLLEKAEEIRQAVRKAYRIHLVTSGQGVAGDADVKLGTFVEQLKPPSDEFCRWEIEDLPTLHTQFYTKTRPTVEEEWAFEFTQLPYAIRSGSHESYMFATRGDLLAGMFGKFGEALLQQNIRVSQGDRATNARIRGTAVSHDAENFLHYNNGIVFLAEEARCDAFAHKLWLNRFQVVNGGQTIRQLHAAAQEGTLRGEVIVPVRVITTAHDKEFANNVTVNLNNQNPMEASFLRSNDVQVVQLASALRTLGWYLERREDEVRLLNDADRGVLEATFGSPLKEHTIGLKTGMQAYAATYMADPELAKRYTKQIFVGKEDDGRFEEVFSAYLTAEKVVLAHRIWSAVGRYVNEFRRLKGRKERGAKDWRDQYIALLGKYLVDIHGAIVDEVIPPGTFFLSAVVFEDWVRLKDRPAEELARILESGDFDILNHEIGVIIAARASLKGSESRTWPTLLKSLTLFTEVKKLLTR